jgi:hypothetical protein
VDKDPRTTEPSFNTSHRPEGSGLGLALMLSIPLWVLLLGLYVRHHHHV